MFMRLQPYELGPLRPAPPTLNLEGADRSFYPHASGGDARIPRYLVYPHAYL